ncbi:sugar ABC transporter substrate-binding protein [Pantoea osteomyelitidis]|uniref:Sugar ABC transporter substrate-binding protein n=1 Tax=Pantoea osteomyelitidis TaxID=3230026 RepID=A0ABW7PXF1_9GAMM
MKFSKNIKKILSAAGGITFLLAFQPVAQAADNQSCNKVYTIGFSHPVGESQFAIALKKKVEAAGEKNGCVKVLLDNTHQSNLESQRATLESWVTRKVDAIVVLPVEATALDGLRRQAQKKGIKWLTYAGATPGVDGSVGFDNTQSGNLVAKDALKWVKQHYPNGDISAAVTTLTPLKGFAGRWDEPLKQFKAAGLPVVSQQDCATQACGLQIAEDALRQHPNLRVFIGINDDAALGALRAFKNAGISPNDLYVAGQDGTVEGLEAVKQGGAYRASAAILLDDLAQSIIDNSIATITDKGRKNYETPVELGTLQNPARLDALLAQYKD